MAFDWQSCVSPPVHAMPGAQAAPDVAPAVISMVPSVQVGPVLRVAAMVGTQHAVPHWLAELHAHERALQPVNVHDCVAP